LTIVHEEAQYFIPQIETKIMNEGWASFWHKRILKTSICPKGCTWSFCAPHPGLVPSPEASIPTMSA
jgi:stage V sporulation protein R